MSGRIEDLNLPDEDSVTPLHFAANENHLEICQIILEKAKEKNPKDNKGVTPSQMAIENRHFEVSFLKISEGQGPYLLP